MKAENISEVAYFFKRNSSAGLLFNQFIRKLLQFLCCFLCIHKQSVGALKLMPAAERYLPVEKEVGILMCQKYIFIIFGNELLKQKCCELLATAILKS